MTAEVPEWNVAIINGEPEVVVNAAALRALMRQSPLGEAQARMNLIALGVPEDLLNEPNEKRK